jgi:hypothetical protein
MGDEQHAERKGARVRERCGFRVEVVLEISGIFRYFKDIYLDIRSTIKIGY